MTNAGERTIILSTIGSAGDVNPFIGIGRRLRENGQRIILVTSAYFESKALEAGLEFISLGSAEDYTSIIQDPGLWEPETGFKVFAGKVILPIMRPLYEILSEFDPTSTTLVAQGQVFGAHLAYEKFDFPFVTIHLQPAAFRSVFEFPLLPGWLPRWTKRLIFKGIDHFVIDRKLAPEINRFRDELSLPVINNVFADWMHSPQANIGLFPDWFAPPQSDWPPQTHLTGFVFFDKLEKDQTLPKNIMDYLDAGKPPVIFTPGTAMKHGEAFFQASMEACQRLNRRGIFSPRIRNNFPIHSQRTSAISTTCPSAWHCHALVRSSIMEASVQLRRR